MKYQTKNKIRLLEILKENSDRHLTIEEIISLAHDVPKASVYRIIDALVKEGLVRQYSISVHSPSCYQYIEGSHSHFHLLCSRCGKLIHLECHEVDKLIKHINKEHGFEVDISKVNLYGLCKECQSK